MNHLVVASDGNWNSDVHDLALSLAFVAKWIPLGCDDKCRR